MSNVSVAYHELSALAAQLTHGQTQIENDLSRLATQVNTLVTSGFVTDRASTAFHAAYEEFTTGARQCIQGLEAMSRFLHTSAQTFEEADTSLASIIRR